MGALRNIVSSADSSSQVEEEVKEALSILVGLAQEKANSAEDQIKLDLQTGKTTDSLSVPITKVIDSRTEYRAVTESSASDIITDIADSISKMFSGDTGIINGIASIANNALTGIMGSGEGQESEIHFYNVVTEYPAIVRMDFYFWGRNTKAQGIMSQVKSAFACVGYKSAVDMSALDFNTFLALYGPVLKAAFGDDQTKLKEMINESKEVYNMFAGQNSTVQTGILNATPNIADIDTDKIVQRMIADNRKYQLPPIHVIERDSLY